MKDFLNNLIASASDVLKTSASPFSPEFYRKHVGKAFIVLFLLYSYVQLRYSYDQAIARVADLKDTLTDARYTSIATWGELTRKNKPEIVRSKISNNANLISSDEPPIIVK